jgi:hypothetical protein
VLGETLAAWVAFPLIAAVLAAGLALALERLTGLRLGALRVPVGLCAAVCLTLAVYWVGGTGVPALAVVVLPALAGLVLEREQVLSWRPSWLALGWLAAYLLHLGPVLTSGEWTWTGYNFVNDTAVQLLLAGWLQDHAMASPDVEQLTTASESVRVYLLTAYPLGTHALLGTLGQLVPVHLAALYQPYIALLAASAAVALAHLARRLGVPAAPAAAIGVVAVGANLFYQYALQGNVKEIAFFMALVAAAATGRELIASEHPLRASLAPAICFAAAFEIYSAASAPYLLALGLALAVAAVARRRRESIRRLAFAGAALTAGALALAAPGLAGAITFNKVASGTFSGADRAADLGHLSRPLEAIQVLGVWLSGDYRVPLPPDRHTLTVILCLVVAVLALAGVAWACARRESAPLVLIAATAVAAAYLVPRLSPYAGGKVLALASPVVVFGAGLGVWAVARRAWPLGAALAVVLSLAVLWSDALAYHIVRLAPVERLEALEDAGRRARYVPGSVLLNEPEEFAKVFHGGANFNVASEAITAEHMVLRAPEAFQNRYFDLDQQVLEFVAKYPAIVTRRSPDASRPPANYRLDYSNRWYEVWLRDPAIRPVEHIPFQWFHRAALPPRCRDVLALARRARPGELLVAARTPASAMLDTAYASRPPSWPTHPWQPEMVVTLTPGTASADVDVPETARYRGWVAGGFGRPIEARVDGKAIGRVQGVNSLGQWLPAGEISLTRGRHRFELVRGGGTLAPGDGHVGELGPLLLERADRTRSLERVAPAQARQLCGRPWDWIERVGRER